MGGGDSALKPNNTPNPGVNANSRKGKSDVPIYDAYGMEAIQPYQPPAPPTVAPEPVRESRFNKADLEEFAKNPVFAQMFGTEKIMGLSKYFKGEPVLGDEFAIEQEFTKWLEGRAKTKEEYLAYIEAANKFPGRKSVLGAGGTVLG